jgi:hypothetical protein
LRSAASGEAQESAWAAQRAYDAVFRFAESQLEEDSLSSDIDVHPVVQQELERQLSDITTLQNLDANVAAAVIGNLRNIARQQAETLFVSSQ